MLHGVCRSHFTLLQQQQHDSDSWPSIRLKTANIFTFHQKMHMQRDVYCIVCLSAENL
jgi:hypothetical protein